MANFAQVVDVENVLQQEILGAEKIAAAEFALRTASAAIRDYCRQQISLVEDDVITLDTRRGRYIFLPELPVVAVSSVIENGTALVDVGDYRLQENGVLYRMHHSWYLGPQAVVVTYTHGRAVIPDMIQAVCARAASRLYQAGLRAEETAGVPGVVSKALGDFSVTFGGESIVEGTMGASGARVLLLSEKDLLDPYRI